jgi:4-hydroxy-tetrahydrodipicolinate reductase
MSEPIRVGVLGGRGRMGQQVCKAVDAADDLELVAMVDAGDWLFSVADAGSQVLVDFTHPDVVMTTSALPSIRASTPWSARPVSRRNG